MAAEPLRTPLEEPGLQGAAEARRWPLSFRAMRRLRRRAERRFRAAAANLQGRTCGTSLLEWLLTQAAQGDSGLPAAPAGAARCARS